MQAADGWGNGLMTLIWRGPAESIAERTRRRVSLRLIPFLFFLYILAYLDRVNVSVAQLTMEDPVNPGSPWAGGLGFDRDIIGFGAGIFFWGYWILEIPSTVSVARWGARWVFVRILVLWGIAAALIGTIGTPFGSALFNWLPHLSPETPLLGYAAEFVNGLGSDPRYQFYFLRFILGFFEGGFFPSVIVYLSLWFRAEDRAKAIAGFMSAIPISSMIGLPLSGLLLPVHWFGISGWRWIFVLEGIAPIFAGIAALFLLPDLPARAKWLPTEERQWLTDQLNREQFGKQGHGHFAWVGQIGMVLLLTFVYFCLNVTSYGLSMFMPAIIKSQSGVSSQTAGMLASLPYVMALIAMLVNGWHSDRTRERAWHVATPLVMLGLGLSLVAVTDQVMILPVIVLILLVGTSMYAHLPAFWPIPSMLLGPTAAASAIGFINMIGNLGGSVGPMMVGKAANNQTSFAPALWKLAPWPFCAAVVILVVGYVRLRKGTPAERPKPLPAGWDEKFAERESVPEEHLTGDVGTPAP